MVTIFNGLKVLDVASFVAAPGAATILGDFGADVIKVEPPGAGDAYRNFPRLPNLPKAEQNYAWELVSRGKRSVALDLTQPAAQAVLQRLAQDADVLITNYPPRVRKKLGLDAERLAAINPRLIYASLTGYGESGDEAERRGFDVHAYWARSGMADNVRPDPDSPPATPTLAMGDQPTAAMFYGAIVTALYHRERNGRGGLVTTSLLASGVWSNGPSIQAVLCGGHVPYRLARAQCRNALTQWYRCRDDRWLSLSVVQEERDWPAFVEAIGIPSLLQDERFSTLAARGAHVQPLLALLEQRFAEDAAAAWQARCDAAGLTSAIAARSEDALHDLQMRAAGAIVPSAHVPASGFCVDSPFRIQGVPKVPPGRAPEVGEHSDEVLRAHGFGEEEIAALRRQGAIQ
jgi:crotonobetainyl-CoA:carnitine CoA-transferase CaiB-like acyl-CoA transferase